LAKFPGDNGLKYFVLNVKCLLKKKLKYITTTLFYQLNHANAQLIRPLETFRKEQIGGAKVGTPICRGFVFAV